MSSYYRYVLKRPSKNPMYGNSTIIAILKQPKQVLNFITNSERHDPQCELVVEEQEFVSEDNLRKNFPLYQRPIWSASFHGYDHLPVLKGERLYAPH